MDAADSVGGKTSIETFSVPELCDWLTDELGDDVGEESLGVLRKNKVCYRYIAIAIRNLASYNL